MVPLLIVERFEGLQGCANGYMFYPHRISRRLRLGFCDSPHDGVIARERGRPPASLARISHQGAPSAVCSRRSLERHQSRC